MCQAALLSSPDHSVFLGFPWWLRWKRIHLPCRRPRFYPWMGKIPSRRKWQPIPIFFSGEFLGQRRLGGSRPWGHKESDTTEWLMLSITSCSVLTCPVVQRGPMAPRWLCWQTLSVGRVLWGQQPRLLVLQVGNLRPGMTQPPQSQTQWGLASWDPIRCPRHCCTQHVHHLLPKPLGLVAKDMADFFFQIFFFDVNHL